MSPDITALLAELDRLHAAATPGEWCADECRIEGPDSTLGGFFGREGYSWSNAEFAAAIHNAYPVIRAELERLRQQSCISADRAWLEGAAFGRNCGELDDMAAYRSAVDNRMRQILEAAMRREGE